MGKRLSKIYTKTGDKGETGLGDGSRVGKTHARIEAIGTIDELNSSVGILIEELKRLAEPALIQVVDFLADTQHRLFDVGGELSIPSFELIKAHHVESVEEQLDALNSDLEPLENFILPAGSMLIAQCHMARSICRRAERRTVSLMEEETINLYSLQFLNRFSDYLFVVARYCALKTGVGEVLWKKG
jgi:cob(I)alamin adenosyltransferase